MVGDDAGFSGDIVWKNSGTWPTPNPTQMM